MSTKRISIGLTTKLTYDVFIKIKKKHCILQIYLTQNYYFSKGVNCLIIRKKVLKSGIGTWKKLSNFVENKKKNIKTFVLDGEILRVFF